VGRDAGDNAERREVTNDIGADGGDVSNGAGDDGVNHELVDIAVIVLGGIKNHNQRAAGAGSIQLIQYSFHSTDSPSGKTWMGFSPSSITAYSSVCVFFVWLASALGCGPWWMPRGCSVA